MRSYLLRCTRCSRNAVPEFSLGVCPYCHSSILRPSLLELHYEGVPPLAPGKYDKQRGIWSYRDYLPAAGIEEQVTLGEGFTPLLPVKRLKDYLGLNNLWLKNETLNPSGSFKDRISAVAVSRAKADGAKGIVIVSSGNMSSSFCAYGAAAGLPVTVIVSPTVSRIRAGQFKAMGARIIVVRGGDAEKMQAAADLAKAEGLCNVSTPYYPFGLEGVKTIAYEIYEQLDTLPSAIVVPVGYGSLVTGLFSGFSELLEADVISKIPRLIAAQSAESPSLVEAFHGGLEEAVPGPAESVCAGINQEVTLASLRVLKYLRQSRGSAVAVADKEIVKTQRLIAELTGISVEPTGATAVAALKTLLQQKVIEPKEKIVVIVTGTGMRETPIDVDPTTLPTYQR